MGSLRGFLFGSCSKGRVKSGVATSRLFEL